jgi:hypothetical protein
MVEIRDLHRVEHGLEALEILVALICLGLGRSELLRCSRSADAGRQVNVIIVVDDRL